MTPTADYIQGRIKYFNELCFGGELPEVQVELSRARSYLGRFERKIPEARFRGRKLRIPGMGTLHLGKPVDIIRISIAFDLSPEVQDDVIVHEMIHYWLSFKGIRDDSPHGRHFRAKMQEINANYGRHIVVRYKTAAKGGQEPAAATATSGKRSFYLCVSRLAGGEWGVTVCASTRIFYLKRELPRYYRLQSMEWYWSADQYFARFPRSNTPKIYKISQEELQLHLQGARRMAFKGRVFGPADEA